VEFVRRATAAWGLRAVHEQDAPSSHPESRRRDQAVDAGADHDVVVATHTDLDASSVLAASSPGEPMIPPPGCVAEPQDHSPSTGVR